MNSDVLGAAWTEMYKMLRSPRVVEIKTEVMALFTVQQLVREGRRFCCEQVDGRWRIEVWP